MARPVSQAPAQTVRMNFKQFSPHGIPRPCWHCASFVAMIYGGTAALCNRPGAVPVQAQPRDGCAFWVRQPGADDEMSAPQAISNVNLARMLARSLKRDEASPAFR